MKGTSLKSPCSIPWDAWKLLVKIFADDMKKYIAALARKTEEGNRVPNEPIPLCCPNANMPPILHKKQYDSQGHANLTRTDTDPEGVTADVLESESEDNPPDASDEDRRVLNTFQFFYPDRHIHMVHVGHISSLVNDIKSNTLNFVSDLDTNSTESQTVSLNTDLIYADNKQNFARTAIDTLS